VKKQSNSFRNVNENPCNMCMPMGGILAFKGIEGAMIILHGSQGCATYMRRTLSEHYNEPIDVASSSLNEKGTVYGGEENFRIGLDNVIKVYNPKMIGVLTTCLAETIGEDIERMAVEYRKEKNLNNLPIITSPTPGYGGTQAEGYWFTLRKIITALAEKTEKHDRINIVVPHLSSADIRELKRILETMKVAYTLLPDYSEVFDAPYTKDYHKIPVGGTTVEEIAAMPGAMATIEFGITVEDSVSVGTYLKEQFGVPLYRLPLPVGIENTDRFVRTITEITGKTVPYSMVLERGRCLDGMVDSHKYNFEGRAVIFGDPEPIYALTCLCLENGISPKIIATGSKNQKLEQCLQQRLEGLDEEYELVRDTDFSQIREKCRTVDINLAIGNSDGRYLTEKDGIPLVRTGFPIHDRVGGQRIETLGYRSSLVLLDRLTNTLLEKKYGTYRAKLLEKHFVATNISVSDISVENNKPTQFELKAR